MDTSSQLFQRRYHDFCETHSLWNNFKLMGIEPFELKGKYSSQFLRKVNKKRRLGQLAEQFVFNQIETSECTELLAENLQIQRDKNTLGELDALILNNGQPIHLEIIYKFYVYDDSIGTSEVKQWIGPNRKDSLIQKMTKLKEKQLPLLHSTHCKDQLNHLNLDHYNFKQQVLFKAQLFVPFKKDISIKDLNKDCICGYYIKTQQLERFKACRFYIPQKLDWFLKPHLNTEWINFENFKIASAEYLIKNQSPLFWMKNETRELSKGFLVWW